MSQHKEKKNVKSERKHKRQNSYDVERKKGGDEKRRNGVALRVRNDLSGKGVLIPPDQLRQELRTRTAKQHGPPSSLAGGSRIVPLQNDSASSSDDESNTDDHLDELSPPSSSRRDMMKVAMLMMKRKKRLSPSPSPSHSPRQRKAPYSEPPSPHAVRS